jgi:hypothetical protein
MSQLASISLCFLFFLLLSLPVSQMYFSVVPERAVGGDEIERKLEKISFDSFLTSRFQKSFDDWLSQKIGFRGYMVRMDNQINYLAFGELDGGVKTDVVLGSKKMLYQRDYIKSVDGFDLVSLDVLERRVLLLKRLQGFLKSRGKSLVLLISPTKASIYPEYIPAEYRSDLYKGRPTNYQNILPLLKKHKINVLDGQAKFKKQSTEVDYLYFAPSGAHWNDVASCEIASSLLESAATGLGKTLMYFSCSPVKIKKTRTSDLDLLRLCNLLISDSFQIPAAYPVTKAKKPVGAFKPRIMFLGDSFMWPIIRFIEWHKVYKSIDMLYYYNTVHHFPGGSKFSVQRDKDAWMEMLLKQDLVVIQASVARLNNLFPRFFDDIEKFVPELAQ